MKEQGGGDSNCNRPKIKISHLQIGLVGDEGKVIDKNRGLTRGVLQSHMEKYGIKISPKLDIKLNQNQKSSCTSRIWLNPMAA